MDKRSATELVASDQELSQSSHVRQGTSITGMHPGIIFFADLLSPFLILLFFFLSIIFFFLFYFMSLDFIEPKKQWEAGGEGG